MAFLPGIKSSEREFQSKLDQYRLAAELRQKTALMPAAIEAKELDRSPHPSMAGRTSQQRSHLRNAFINAAIFAAGSFTALAAVPVGVFAVSVVAAMTSFGLLVKHGSRFLDDELERGHVHEMEIKDREWLILRLQRTAAHEVARELHCDSSTVELSLDRNAIVNLRLEVEDRAEELWLARGWSDFAPDDASFERIYEDIAKRASNAAVDLARASEPQSLQGPNQSLSLGLRQQANTGE